MRRRLFRPTIGMSMVAVAMVAVSLWWASSRPYPCMAALAGTWHVIWSDGGATTCDGPAPLKVRDHRWFIIVDFPDGTTGYYLTVRRPSLPTGPKTDVDTHESHAE